jgi:hypothetical protein
MDDNNPLDILQSASVEGAGAGARVIREVIRTPAFLEIIKTNMAELDPESARYAIRTVLWEDPELTLSLASTAPQVVNYLVEAVLELGRQLNHFPGPLLDAFMDQLGTGFDAGRVRELPGVYSPLLEKVDFQRKAARAAGAAVNAVARTINRAAERNPYFLRDAVTGVDGREIGRAVFAVMRSACLWGFSVITRVFKSVAGYGMRGDPS